MVESPQDADGHAAPAVPGMRVRQAFEQVSDHLRELIVSGALVPGERLPTEIVLAKRFGVNRGTVREALRLLAAQNLVRKAKGTGGGTYVNVPTVEHVSAIVSANLGLMRAEVGVEALLEVRELLEVPAARLAALRRSSEDVQALLKLTRDPPAGLADQARFAADREFHFRLVEAAGNPALRIAVEPIFTVLHRQLQETGSALTQAAQWAVNEEHREIAAAIAEGDADTAESAMRRHLQSLRPRYERQPRSTKLS